MMLDDQKREVARDLLAKVRSGQLSPDEADEAAFYAGVGPFSRVPSPDEYWPTSKAHWTLPMVLAWIAWRTFSEVREWDAEYGPLRLDWGPVGPRIGTSSNAGYTLYRRRHPTSEQFLKWGGKRFGPWVKGRDGRPAVFGEATPKEAMSMLRKALEAGDLVGYGVLSASAPHSEIPAHQWIDITIVPSRDGDEQLQCGTGSNRITYRDVRLPSRLVMEVWPDHARSGLPDQAPRGLAKVDTPEAWLELYVEAELITQVPGKPKRRQIMPHDLPDLRRLNEQRAHIGQGLMTYQETVDWAAERGLSRDSARTLRYDLPAELKLKNGERPR